MLDALAEHGSKHRTVASLDSKGGHRGSEAESDRGVLSPAVLNNSNGQVGIDSSAFLIGCSVAEMATRPSTWVAATSGPSTLGWRASVRAALQRRGQLPGIARAASWTSGLRRSCASPSAALSLGSGLVPGAITLGSNHTCANQQPEPRQILGRGRGRMPRSSKGPRGEPFKNAGDYQRSLRPPPVFWRSCAMSTLSERPSRLCPLSCAIASAAFFALSMVTNAKPRG